MGAREPFAGTTRACRFRVIRAFPVTTNLCKDFRVEGLGFVSLNPKP